MVFILLRVKVHHVHQSPWFRLKRKKQDLLNLMKETELVSVVRMLPVIKEQLDLNTACLRRLGSILTLLLVPDRHGGTSNSSTSRVCVECLALSHRICCFQGLYFREQINIAVLQGGCGNKYITHAFVIPCKIHVDEAHCLCSDCLSYHNGLLGRERAL